MSPRTRIVQSVALAAATATLTACASGATASSGPAAGRPVAQSTTTTSPSASPPPSPDSGAIGRAGKIAVDQLAAQKVRIPAWQFPGEDDQRDLRDDCPSGLQTLHRSAVSKVNHDSNMDLLHVYYVVYTNLDNDPAAETAALVTCQFGEAAIGQVIAFDRDSAGHIVTLGTVASGIIWRVEARPEGGITIDLSDSEACCSTPKATEMHQIRSYVWQSGRFAQVTGPTSFVPHGHKIDIAVTVDSATWSGRNGDRRTGTVKLTVTNNSGYQSGDILVINEDDSLGAGNSVKIAGLKPHASAVTTIAVTVFDDGTRHNEPTVSIHELGSGAVDGDAKPANDWAYVPLW